MIKAARWPSIQQFTQALHGDFYSERSPSRQSLRNTCPMDFDLTRLGQLAFEGLVQDLFSTVFADRKLSFATGPWGGRE